MHDRRASKKKDNKENDTRAATTGPRSMPETDAHDPQEIEAALKQVLESQTFARSARARDLLRYLVHGKRSGDLSRLKESAIGLDVFGRDPATYDSATDGIVRVSVNRLRDLLDRYYADEGSGTALRFEIQRGGYVPIIRRATPGGLPPLPRIAVLPLANFTGDDSLDALCDGLTEDVIDALAQVPEVRVIARTSSFKYKGVALDVRTVARDLSVDAIVEGSVQTLGTRIRVTAQMILGSDGTHLWSHAFESEANDRAVLQLALIDLMKRSLGASPAAGDTDKNESETLATVSLLPTAEAAIVAYHRGLYSYRKDTSESFRAAEIALNDAINIEPEFARAHAALARVRWAIGNAGIRPLADCAALALQSARHALTLAPDDPMVLSAHGYLEFFVNYDPAAAFASAARAIAIAPNAVEARLFHAKICTYTRRFADADASLTKAQSLDPLSLDPLHGRIALSIVSHDYVAALALTDQLLALEPASSIGCWNRGHILRKLNRFDDCDKNFADTVARWPDSARYATLMQCLTRASAGDLHIARTLREAALVAVPWDEDPMVYAIIDALLGDDDAVYRAWEHSIARHDPYVYLSYYHEEFERFRREPRFVAVTAALNLG
jgi:TolB-like protein/Tfp pilus assembly protein PilF